MKKKIVQYFSITLPLSLALVLAQIYAPPQLKPLANRLLDYPHAISTITQFYHETPRVILSTASPKLAWPPFINSQPPLIAPVKSKYLLEEDVKPTNTKSKVSVPVINKNFKLEKEEQEYLDEKFSPPPILPLPTTPLPPDIPTQVYTELNGDEQFRYGYQVKDTDTYLDKANGDTCQDNQGTISGTYCAPNGKRYNIAIESTEQAAQEFTQAIANKIVTLSEAEIKELSGDTLVTACTVVDDLACQLRIEQQIVYTLATDALVIKSDQLAFSILNSWQQNTKVNDFVNLSAQDLKEKYSVDDISQLITSLDQETQTSLVSARRAQTIINDPSVSKISLDQNLQILVDLGYYQAEDIPAITAAIQANQIKAFTDPSAKLTSLAGCPANNPGECRDLTWEGFLGGLGYDADKVSTILTDRQTNVKNQIKLKAFLDPTKSPLSHAAQEQGQTLESYLKTIGVDEGDIKEVIQARQDGIADLALINDFANPLISDSELARRTCAGNHSCGEQFYRERYLTQLHNPAYATYAKSSYQLNLFNFSKYVDDDSFQALPVATQNTLLNANTEVQQAFAAYSFEKNKTPGTIVTPESSNQLALDFAKKIQANPNIIQEYSLKFADHKDLYQGLIDTTRLFSLTEGKKNSVVTAQLDYARFHASISGLSKNGQAVSWDEASPEYKQKARELACADDQKEASLTELCQTLKTKKPSEYLPGYSQEAVERWEENQNQTLIELDSQLVKNSGPLLQQVFDQQIGANIRLSTSFSNVATIDNPLTPSELKADAINFALNPPTPNAGSRGRGPAPVTTSNELSESQIAIANEYLDRQLVTETYKIGGGLAAGVGGFSAGMAACLPALAGGATAVIIPVCGAVGGLIGWGAAQVPLYEQTAEEYQSQRTAIAENLVGGSDIAAGVVQSLYSNQGAWGDEGPGRSITTRDNQFALYDAINSATDGQLISQIQANPELQANLAIQGQILNQSEVYQNRQEAWTYASLPIAGLTGALNVGVGAQLAKSFTGRAITDSGFKLLNALSQAPTFAASTALNQVQTALQFDSTGGDMSLLTTPEQIDYQVCVMTYDPDSPDCVKKLDTAIAQIASNRDMALNQAFYTDLLMQVYQTGTSFKQAQKQYRAQIDYAEAHNIPTQGRTIDAITADINLAIKNATPPDGVPLKATLIPIPDTKNTESNVITILNADLENLKANKLTPVQDSDGKFRLIPSPDASESLIKSVDNFNKLADDVELANGNPLTKEQATILATAPDIVTGVKSVTPGGGKTSYIVLIEHAKKNKSVYTGANKTDTLDAINTMLKTEAGQDYAKKRLGEVYYVEEDGTIIRVNLDEASFDPSGSKTKVSATEFDTILADPSRIVSIYGTHNGMGWDAQRTSWGQKIISGDYNTDGQGFHIIGDEAAKDALASVAISGEPEAISKSKLGQNTITTFDELMEINSLKSVIEDQIDPKKPNLLARVKNKQEFTIQDPLRKTQVLRDLAQGALSQIEAEQQSLLSRLTSPKPNVTDLETLRTLITRMDEAISQNDPILHSQVQGDLDTLLKRPGNSVIDAISTRYTLMTDILNQLGLTENDFGLSTDGKTILLKSAKGETDQTYSSVGQQLVLYEIGKLMLKARGENTTLLPTKSDLTISVTLSQMTLNEWYQKIYRGGNSIAFLDGTPDPLVHLGLGGMQGEVVKLPIDSAIEQVNNYTNETDFVERFNAIVRQPAEVNKMPLLVLSDTLLGFDQVTGKIRQAHDTREVLIAQYNQGGEEFIHFEKGGSGKKTVYKTKAEWEAKLHELASNNPDDALVIIQGRDRALDISVDVDFLNMRWYNDLPRESIGTTSIQDSATQGVFRDRVFVDRTSESLITKVAQAKKISNAEAAKLVDATKQYYVLTHESLGVKTSIRTELPGILATQHAEHLNNLRLQATLTMLGDSQKNAIDILTRRGGDFGIAENKAFKSFIEVNQAEGQRLQEIYKREITNKPLTNPNEIALEIFARGGREDARLRTLLQEAETKLNLNQDQVKQLRVEWGIDQDYPSFETYLARLNQRTDGITPRDFTTPAKMFSPGAEVMYWSTNSSMDPSSPPQYRVPAEVFIESTNAKTVKSAPAASVTTPDPITITPPTNPILDSFNNLRRAYVRPILNGRPLQEVLEREDFESMIFVYPTYETTVSRVNNTYIYQHDADSQAITTTDINDILALLPAPSDDLGIVYNDTPQPDGSYQTPTNPATALGEKLAETLKTILPQLLLPAPKDEITTTQETVVQTSRDPQQIDLTNVGLVERTTNLGATIANILNDLATSPTLPVTSPSTGVTISDTIRQSIEALLFPADEPVQPIQETIAQTQRDPQQIDLTNVGLVERAANIGTTIANILQDLTTSPTLPATSPSTGVTISDTLRQSTEALLNQPSTLMTEEEISTSLPTGTTEVTSDQFSLLNEQYTDTQTQVNTLIAQVSDAEVALKAAELRKLDADILLQKQQKADQNIVDLTKQKNNLQNQLAQSNAKLQSLNTQITQLEKTIVTIQPPVTPQQQQARAQRVLTDLIALVDKRIDEHIRIVAANVGKTANMTEADAKKNLVDTVRRAYDSAQVAESARQALVKSSVFANDPEGAASYARDIAGTITDTWFISRHMALSRLSVTMKTDTSRERNITAVGDVHGDWNQLVRLLSGQVTNENGKRVTKPLLDRNGNWIGGPTDYLILTGDLVDRAPTGVNSAQTAERIMKLQEQAGNFADGTPRVKVLLGNHDVNALYAYWRMKDLISEGQSKQAAAEEGSVTGMRPSVTVDDLLYIYDHPQLAKWLMNLDGIMVIDGVLYMHSDIVGYVNYGSSVAAVNNRFRSIVQNNEGLDVLYDLMVSLTNRRQLFDPANVDRLLQTYNAQLIIHGHSQNETPTDKRVRNIDGGLSEKYAKRSGAGENRGRFYNQHIIGGQTTTVSITSLLPQATVPTLSARPLSGQLVAYYQQQVGTSVHVNQLNSLQTTYDSIQTDIQHINEAIAFLDQDLQTTNTSRSQLEQDLSSFADAEKNVAMAKTNVIARKSEVEREQALLAKAQEFVQAQQATSAFLATLRERGLTVRDFAITLDGIADLSVLGRTFGDLLAESMRQYALGNEMSITQLQQTLRNAKERASLLDQLNTLPSDIVLSDNLEDLSLSELRALVVSLKDTPEEGADTGDSPATIAQPTVLFGKIREFIRESNTNFTLARLIYDTLGTSKIDEWSHAYTILSSLASETEFTGVNWGATHLDSEIQTFFSNRLESLLPTLTKEQAGLFITHLWTQTQVITTRLQTEHQTPPPPPAPPAPALTPAQLAQINLISIYQTLLGNTIVPPKDFALQEELDYVLTQARQQHLSTLVTSDQVTILDILTPIISTIKSDLTQNRDKLFVSQFSLPTAIADKISFDPVLKASLTKSIKQQFDDQVNNLLADYEKQQKIKLSEDEQKEIQAIQDRIMHAGSLISSIKDRNKYYFDIEQVREIAGKILGVDQNASSDEIKQAYRKLSSKFHPDLNPGNKVAEDIFKALGNAKEILDKNIPTSIIDNVTVVADHQIDSIVILLGSTYRANSTQLTSLWDKPLRVGRSSQSEIYINVGNTEMSRTNFVLNRDQKGYYVENTSQTLGTKVNGFDISGKTSLQDGDLITAGTQTFYVRILPNELLLIHQQTLNHIHINEKTGDSYVTNYAPVRPIRQPSAVRDPTNRPTSTVDPQLVNIFQAWIKDRNQAWFSKMFPRNHQYQYALEIAKINALLRDIKNRESPATYTEALKVFLDASYSNDFTILNTWLSRHNLKTIRAFFLQHD